MKVEIEQIIIELMEAGGDLENLPPKVKRLLELLLEERKELLARVKELEEAQEQSKEKSKKNSRNSSKPRPKIAQKLRQRLKSQKQVGLVVLKQGIKNSVKPFMRLTSVQKFMSISRRYASVVTNL